MKDQIFSKLKKSLLEYSEVDAKIAAEESIKQGISPIETIDVLIQALSEIGDKFGKGELFLPDLMLASKTMEITMPILEDELQKRGLKRETLGKIVIGTVFGDLHSIGKNMVATLLSSAGFEVVDLGVSVTSERFIEQISKNRPDVLALSALLTTTINEQKNIIEFLIKNGLRDKVKVIIGGGPVTEEFADEIGADGYEPTAILAVDLVKRLLKNK